MNTEDLARQHLTQQRQYEAHQQEAMLSRAEAELQASDDVNAAEEQAREHLTQLRQHEEHWQETMLERTEEEVRISDAS
jgi:lipopolysaccharide biosynthesis regulator YciM